MGPYRNIEKPNDVSETRLVLRFLASLLSCFLTSFTSLLLLLRTPTGGRIDPTVPPKMHSSRKPEQSHLSWVPHSELDRDRSGLF
jgi:hypothetical protein